MKDIHGTLWRKNSFNCNISTLSFFSRKCCNMKRITQRAHEAMNTNIITFQQLKSGYQHCHGVLSPEIDIDFKISFIPVSFPRFFLKIVLLFVPGKISGNYNKIPSKIMEFLSKADWKTRMHKENEENAFFHVSNVSTPSLFRYKSNKRFLLSSNFLGVLPSFTTLYWKNLFLPSFTYSYLVLPCFIDSYQLLLCLT